MRGVGCFLLVVLGCLLTSVRAISATIEADTSGSVPIITIIGGLQYGDEKKFINVALAHPTALVGLMSPGGNLLAGIEIGKAIRLKGYMTAVPGDATCASACALAWLGGRKRLMSRQARIGFHAAYVDDAGTNTVTGTGNALVGAYLNQLGLPTGAIIFVTSASPDGMTWLSAANAQKVGLEVETLPDETPPATRAAPPPGRAAPPQSPYVSNLPSGVDWTAQGEWVQAASRPSLAEAIEVGAMIRAKNPNTSVFQYRNGWYAVVVGPFSSGRGPVALAALIRAGEVPADSLVTRGDAFAALAWGSPKPRPPAGR